MDTDCFDRLSRSVSTILSRRGLACTFGLAAIALSTSAEAKKHKRKKKKRIKRNEFGCVNVGGKCRGKDALCCSGICHGRKPKQGEKDNSRCVAHDASTCQAGQQSSGCKDGGGIVACITSAGGSGFCDTTTGNAGFCRSDTGAAVCQTCNRDADCRASCGPQAACIRCDHACLGVPYGNACAGPTDHACF